MARRHPVFVCLLAFGALIGSPAAATNASKPSAAANKRAKSAPRKPAKTANSTSAKGQATRDNGKPAKGQATRDNGKPAKTASTPAKSQAKSQAKSASTPAKAPLVQAKSNQGRSAELRPAVTRRDPGPTSYFLSADPHVPLAVVREGAVEDAVPSGVRGKSCGRKSRWAVRGSAWYAVDAWGQFVGKATVEELDPYDVTACDEVIFAPKYDQNSDHLLFVSVDSTYRPAASLKWNAPYAASQKFRAQVEQATAREGQTKKRKLPWRCTTLRESARFFEVLTPSGDKQQLAVGGADAGYLIARYEGGQWIAEHTQNNGNATPMCFRPVSVFDMNADGQPEVVMRYVQGDGEEFGEFVLSRSSSGKWRLAAQSPGGGTP